MPPRLTCDRMSKADPEELRLGEIHLAQRWGSPYRTSNPCGFGDPAGRDSFSLSLTGWILSYLSIGRSDELHARLLRATALAIHWRTRDHRRCYLRSTAAREDF
mgnify:CR=1 FL=1